MYVIIEMGPGGAIAIVHVYLRSASVISGHNDKTYTLPQARAKAD